MVMLSKSSVALFFFFLEFWELIGVSRFTRSLESSTM